MLYKIVSSNILAIADHCNIYFIQESSGCSFYSNGVLESWLFELKQKGLTNTISNYKQCFTMCYHIQYKQLTFLGYISKSSIKSVDIIQFLLNNNYAL